MMYTVYNAESGEVLRTGFASTPENVALQAGPGEGLLPGMHLDSHLFYAPGGVPTLRPHLVVADMRAAPGAEVTVASGLPEGTRASVAGADLDVVDGTVKVMLPLAGEVRVLLAPPWPWCPAEVRTTPVAG